MPPDVQESVELWHSEMSERFAGLCPEGSTDSAPTGTVRGVHLGDIGAYDISGSPQVLRRSPRAARRHGSDLLKICSVRSGRAILRQGDRELVVESGAMMLYDVELPYALRFDGLWSCTVMTLPRRAMSLTARELDCALDRIHDGSRGPGALFENFISNALSGAVGVNGVAAGFLGDAGANLASAALVSCGLSADVGVSTREQILRYVRRHLSSPELSVTAVAGALHMSPRTIQRQFSDGETTLSSLIRIERLTRVRRDLRDPSLRDHSIAALSARWCFYDAPAFSRAFKSEFGISPSEARHGVQSSD